MKTPFKYFALLLALPLFAACSSDSDEEVRVYPEPRELKLSVTLDETRTVVTKDVDFEFEILDGNGGYTATVSERDGDPDAIVTIEGNKVKVNILVGNLSRAYITIADRTRQKESFSIESTNESLKYPSHEGLLFDVGQTYVDKDIKFGAGAPYTVERVRGNASEVVIEDGYVKATALTLGDTYYKLRDKRGSILNFTTHTNVQYDLDAGTNYFEIVAKNNHSPSITFKWGDKWEIVGKTEKVTEDTYVGVPLNSRDGYSVLFIHTTDKGTGTDTVTLRDKDGNLAVVKIYVL